MNDIMGKLAALLDERRGADPETSYVAGLYAAGLGGILAKVEEEAAETISAAKDAEQAGTEHLVRETADLWFHTMVMLAHLRASPMDVLKELERRFGRSGLAEKAARPD